jgi:hypothetical protein
MDRLVIILLALFLNTSCSEIKTNDPEIIYKYWSGSTPPTELQLLKGQYWQSAHWTKEYIMFLKLNPTIKWWNEFIEINQLQLDNEKWTKPNDAPNWFNPNERSIMYCRSGNFDQGSKYFIDTLTNECYIYEIQL